MTPCSAEQRARSIALRVMGHDDIDDATDAVLSFARIYAAEQVAQARAETEEEIVGSEVERNLQEWGIYAEVKAERVRQGILKAAGKFQHTPSDAAALRARTARHFVEVNRKLAGLREKAAKTLLETAGWKLVMEWERRAYSGPPATSPDRVLLAQMINEVLDAVRARRDEG